MQAVEDKCTEEGGASEPSLFAKYNFNDPVKMAEECA
jgi:hypothetical protein